jgi:hypothetical protein
VGTGLPTSLNMHCRCPDEPCRHLTGTWEGASPRLTALSAGRRALSAGDISEPLPQRNSGVLKIEQRFAVRRADFFIDRSPCLPLTACPNKPRKAEFDAATFSSNVSLNLFGR